MKHAFGTGEPFTVGIEEEVLLVDALTHALTPIAERVHGALDLPEGAFGHEAYAAQIELRSPPSRTAAEAVAALQRGRDAARAAGATLLAAGLHPAARAGDAPLVDADRYRRVHEEMRGLIQRTPECALHVHVGMPDPESAVAAYNALRGWLPLLAGLAASSPFWFGVDSGLASARAALIRAYPGRGVPRSVRDLEDYECAIADSTAGGGPGDYTLLWWDVRLHPRLGTVEVREMDAPSRLADVAGIAALIQGLARHAVEVRPRPVASEAISWSAFRAARDGVEAEILHEGRTVPLSEAAREAAALARRHAPESVSTDLTDEVERILREGGAPARHRAAHCGAGMQRLLEVMVAETAQRASAS